MNKKNNFWYWFLLVLILIFAGTIRFWNITERGLIEWDESYYYGVAKTYRAAFDGILEKTISNPELNLSNKLLREGVAYNTTAKPGFIFLLFFSSFVFGMNPYLPLFISIIAGLLTIYLTAQIAKKVFSEKVGVFASLLLTLSFFHVHYSRSGNVASVSSVFIYLSLFLYLLSQGKKYKKKLFFSGFFTGYAFTTHYNLFWVPLCFLVIFLFENYRKKQINIIRPFLFYLGSIIPLLIFEIQSLATSFLISLMNLTNLLKGTINLTYLSDLYFQSVLQKRGISIKLPFFYFNLIKQWEGLIVLIIFFISLFWLIRKTKVKPLTKYFSILAFTTSPFIIFTIFSYSVARNIAVIIPAISIIIAAFSISVYNSLKKQNKALCSVIAVLVLISILIAGLLNIQPLLNMKSGMPYAIQFMKKQGSVKHITSEFYLSRVYVERQKTLDTLFPFQNKDPYKIIKLKYEEGFKFLLTGGSRFSSVEKNLQKLLEKTPPSFITSNSFKISAYEQLAEDVRNNILSSPDEIKVYSLKRIIEKNKNKQ